MPTYDVTIRATVTKTIRVEADTEHEASDLAHGAFTTDCDGSGERYEEQCLDVTTVAEGG